MQSSISMLVVDDSQVARMMIKGYSQDLRPDWQIHEAENGEKALSLAQDNHYQLITLDLNMPGMDGFELAQKIAEKQPQASLFVITANIQPAIQQKARERRLHFITKPVTEDKIRSMVEISTQ